MEEQILQLDGKSIYYRHSGEGYPVVLLHGIPTHSGLWDGVMPILEKSCSVYAFDLPGYGKSAGYDSRDLNIRSQARLLYKALEKLDLKKPVIAGHDMGGGIAQIMALSRPGELSGMVLLDSVCYDSWPINLLCAESKVSVLLKNLPPEVALDVFTSYMADGLYDKSLAGKLAEKYWKYFSSPGGEKKFLKIVESLDSKYTLEIAPVLHNINIPVLILWGRHDEYIRLSFGYRLSEDIKGSKIEIIDKAGHFLPEDQPVLTAELMDRFIKEI